MVFCCILPRSKKMWMGDGLDRAKHGFELPVSSSRSTREAVIAGRSLIGLPHSFSTNSLFARRNGGRSSTTPTYLGGQHPPVINNTYYLSSATWQAYFALVGGVAPENLIEVIDAGAADDLMQGLGSNDALEGIEGEDEIYGGDGDGDDLKTDPTYPGTVTVSLREDIGMTEVLLDRLKEANGQRFWEASYWPLKTELKGIAGNVSSIRCETRNDPLPEKRYGKRGWTCSSGMRMTPNVSASIEIYVAHIEQMPRIYEQVKQVIANAKKAGE